MAQERGFPFGWVIAVWGILALSACAAGGGIAAPTERAPTEGYTAADGSVLATTQWGPDQPVAVILALHGYGDHATSTFDAAGAAWAKRGIRTIAYDQRGFGRNASRGFWPGADTLIEDARAVSKQVRVQFPCTPLVLLGHSMGGGVALAAMRGEPSADALLLAVPAIWGGERLNPFHRALAWTASVLVPDMRFTGRGVVRIQATDNIEALRALQNDPLYLSPPSAREIMGLVRVTDRAADAAPLVNIPALMLLGAKDQIVPSRAVRDVFARLPGETRVVEYPEAWHLIFRDLQAKVVWADVASWVLAVEPYGQCPSSPS